MALTLKQIHDMAIAIGRKQDPRPAKEIEAVLSQHKEQYEKMNKKKKECFDKERLVNPYLDTRVLYGTPTTSIKSMMACIDVGPAELLLANTLREKGTAIDMVLSHHPEGRALADLAQVMRVQDTISEELGISPNIAEKLMNKRMGVIDRAVHPINHYQAVDTARLLGIPFMCCHTPADNCVHDFLVNFINKNQKKWRTIEDFMNALLEIPEFFEGEKMGAGPKIFLGSKDSKLGKIAVTGMTGGTSGSEDIYEHYSHAGVGTLVQMHISEKHRENAEKHHLNIVITGHIPSDSLGLNLLLDPIEKKGVKIIPASGFIRVKR
ncbi:MAG: NGG1p interacting factor NIF3 [Candidatus Gracilibacteria bacterium]